MVPDAENFKMKAPAGCLLKESITLLCLHVKKGEGAPSNPVEVTDPSKGSPVSSLGVLFLISTWG